MSLGVPSRPRGMPADCQVDPQSVFPLSGGEFGQWGVADDTGTVDRYVERAEFGVSQAHCDTHLIGIAEVTLNGHSDAPEGCDVFNGRLRVGPVEADQPNAAAGQRYCRGPADAGGGAGHQDDAARQVRGDPPGPVPSTASTAPPKRRSRPA